MKANPVTKCFITADDKEIPVSVVREVFLSSRYTYPHGGSGINIIPAIRILFAVYPGLSLQDVKDMINLYLAIEGMDVIKSKGII